MAYDFFVAALKCPKCGAVSPDDTSTNIQTKMRMDPDGSLLRVGDSVEPSEPELAYYTIRKPTLGGVVRILDTWECRSCGRADNWAEIVIDGGGIIRSIAAVPLNRETFQRGNFIGYNANRVAADLLSVPVGEISGKDVVKVLSERL